MPLLGRHGRAFSLDPYYRLGWLVWPQAAALLAAGWLVFAEYPPTPPSMPMEWAHARRNPAATAALGQLRDAARSDPTARQLLRERADKGDGVAEFYMATLLDPMINSSNASPQATTEALDWYRRASEQNIAAAQGNYGNLLSAGRFGIEPDYPQAVSLLEKAAAVVPVAQRQLGILYRDGRGVAADVSKGMDLIRKAADRGDAIAETILGQALDKGGFNLTPDHHEAVLLFQRAAQQNVAVAQRDLALHLRAGSGVDPDPGKAAYWFKKAAENGDPFAKTQIAPNASVARPAISPQAPATAQ